MHPQRRTLPTIPPSVASGEQVELEAHRGYRIELLTKKHALGASIVTADAFQREALTAFQRISVATFRQWSDGFAQRSADDGVSTIALDSDGRVVAACLCVDGADRYVAQDEDPDNDFGTFDAVLHHVQGRFLASRGFAAVYSETPDPWADDAGDAVHESESAITNKIASGLASRPALPHNRYLHILTIACEHQAQGRGLVARLCEWTLALGRLRGFAEAFLEATNPRSQATSVRLGFRSEQILSYRAYVTPDGTRPLREMPADAPLLILYTYPLLEGLGCGAGQEEISDAGSRASS